MNTTNIPKILLVGHNHKSTYVRDILLQMEARGEVELVYQCLEGTEGGGCSYNGLTSKASFYDEFKIYSDCDFSLTPSPYIYNYNGRWGGKVEKKRATKPYFRHNERY